jgi:UPF0716 protein FxsA
MLSGAAMTLAAILLILPGPITDFVGLLLLIGPLRRFAAAACARANSEPSDGPTVIDGDFRVVDDPPPAPPAAETLPPPRQGA